MCTSCLLLASCLCSKLIELHHDVSQALARTFSSIPSDIWKQHLCPLNICRMHRVKHRIVFFAFHARKRFGPPSLVEISPSAFRRQGLLLREYLSDRSMFGSKPQNRLLPYAVDLAAHFSLAFPVTRDLLYLPMQVSFVWDLRCVAEAASGGVTCPKLHTDWCQIRASQCNLYARSIRQVP